MPKKDIKKTIKKMVHVTVHVSVWVCGLGCRRGEWGRGCVGVFVYMFFL